ncbi:uncharacterized protein [Diabrotica undecimpunctata]|uniref:uncharacterized protein n=1 Tax=Diabrotica undecimpunctata TaxID=50387 RepID=UPI003B63F2FA
MKKVTSNSMKKYDVRPLNDPNVRLKGICERLGMKKTKNTAYHSQSNGLVKQINKTVRRYLAKMMVNHQRDHWDQYLPFFSIIYRFTVNELTGQTPVKVLFGREMQLPCDLEFRCRLGEGVVGEDYVNELRR